MKKTGDDEDSKIKGNQANFSNFQLDTSKYQTFVDEIVILK